METPGYLKELANAVELIKMLEHLSTSCSRQGNGQAEIPWAGMQITLGQSREIISRALAELCSEAVRDSYSEPAQQNTQRDDAANARSASLSERIQQAPSGQNRVRELLTNVSSSSGRRGSNAEEDVASNDKR
jgi:hypothetical protein